MTEFEMKMKAAQKAVGLGRLSRRDFIQFALASGMTLAAAQTLSATARRRTLSIPPPGPTASLSPGASR